MDDYSTVVSRTMRESVLNVISEECERLKANPNEGPKILGKVYYKIFRSLINENVPKCGQCDYYSYDDTYRCVKCHKDREIEPCNVELPIEIFNVILVMAGVSVSLVNKELRNLNYHLQRQKYYEIYLTNLVVIRVSEYINLRVLHRTKCKPKREG